MKIILLNDAVCYLDTAGEAVHRPEHKLRLAILRAQLLCLARDVEDHQKNVERITANGTLREPLPLHHAPATLNDLYQSRTQQRLGVLDTDLACRLGYSNASAIRSLIKYHLPSLQVHGPVSISKSVVRGRSATTYYLNQKQALMTCTLSKSDLRNEVCADIIHSFNAYQHIQPNAQAAQ